MKWLWIVAVLLSPVALSAQEIPSGTILPVELRSGINSAKMKAGEAISARLAQDVHLPNGWKIHAGAKVFGHIVESKAASDGSEATLSLRFDRVVVSHRSITIASNLRAVASPMEVWDAQIPLTGPDRGTPENAWTTVQVGGDEVVYRGGGPLAKGMTAVGEPTYHGVLARTTACRGTEIDNQPQSLWVFSSDACGAYGLRNLAILHAGRTEPVGQIVLAAKEGEVKLDKGSGLLLRVRNARGGVRD
jgi:hypothetical protein